MSHRNIFYYDQASNVTCVRAPADSGDTIAQSEG